mmetsp:Transcript_39892/g.70181  ORF Transcript_39892/g.70181 Transcript_39892/m.70181 type:complete len:227 (-) Transcript_39892:1022-1702(-)
MARPLPPSSARGGRPRHPEEVWLTGLAGLSGRGGRRRQDDVVVEASGDWDDPRASLLSASKFNTMDSAASPGKGGQLHRTSRICGRYLTVSGLAASSRANPRATTVEPTSFLAACSGFLSITEASTILMPDIAKPVVSSSQSSSKDDRCRSPLIAAVRRTCSHQSVSTQGRPLATGEPGTILGRPRAELDGEVGELGSSSAQSVAARAASCCRRCSSQSFSKATKW